MGNKESKNDVNCENAEDNRFCQICYLSPKDEGMEDNQIQTIHSKEEGTCNFDICQECLLQWIVTRITKDLLKAEVKIPCPNHECEQEISLEDTQENLSRVRLETVLDKLTNVYVCNESDIRKCPNSECCNAGVIIPKPCYQSLECQCCGYKWKDITQYTVKDKLLNALFGKSNYYSNFWSYLSEVLRGEPCPECGIVIFKAGGCPHMVCQKCSFEFCWDCLGYYPDYQHKSNTMCPLRIFLLYPFLVIFGVILNLKLCYSSQIMATIQIFILIFLGKLIIVVLLMIAGFLEWLFINKFNRFRRFRPKYKGKEYWFTVVMIFLYPIFWYLMISFLNEKLSLAYFIISTLTFMIILGITIAVFKILALAFKKIKEDPSVKNILFILSFAGIFYCLGLCKKGMKKMKSY